MGGRHDDCLSIPTPYIRGLTAVATVPGGAALLTSVEGSAPRLVRFAPSDGGEVTELDFGDFLAWARGMRPGYVIPHLHMIVPGGGISLDGTRWMHCRLSFFLPVRVLSRLFRRLFLAGLADARAAGRLGFFGHN